MFAAHSIEGRPESEWQPLAGHLRAVADLAAARGAKFGAGGAAALAGLLHDLGKYSAAFQRRIRGSGASVDHATAGAQTVRHLATAPIDRGTAELLAYAIAGHHGGLPDREAEPGSLSERLSKRVEPLDPSWRTEIRPVASGLFPEAFRPEPEMLPFQLGFLGRMLFSCLVDADYRDTEAFYAAADRREVERDWPPLTQIVDRLLESLDARFRAMRATAPATDVNRLRSEILAHVRARAEEPTGRFTLTVPTGGGKTLASLAFALEHARRHRLDRIVYAIPFTSVIDQTASLFREILGDDVVLEHHSAIDEERLRDREGADKLRLAMEDWAAPVVVTTNVQLFESLFSNRPSRCRKLHNLARSVLVLDEAQTLPLPVLRPCVAALDELARNYGTSVVLCTATQPALGAPRFQGGFKAAELRELAPRPQSLAAELRRVVVRRVGEMTDGDLVAALDNAPRSLVIVNSRAHALALYRLVVEAELQGCIHLTTRQHAVHRRAILAEVRRRLANGEACRLIATSLVEAGVDLDFPGVWRAEAGLDQIAQAAGRCNREGRRPVGESVVTVFRPAEFKPPREIAQLAADFARAARHHDDLLSLAAIRDYFGEVYWRTGDGLDEKRVLAAFQCDARGTGFAYRTVADGFRMIESGLAPVIVPHDEVAARACAELSRPAVHAGRIARTLQPYTVQVPPPARRLLVANGHVRYVEARRFGEQFAVMSSDGLYRMDVGLIWEEAAYLELENMIV